MSCRFMPPTHSSVSRSLPVVLGTGEDALRSVVIPFLKKLLEQKHWQVDSNTLLL